ncbi:MAG: hypothetical protein JWP51_3944 [Bradyrhizobium sp.]|nr:hypothetical protein [Bradyrhizobium sp.]
MGDVYITRRDVSIAISLDLSPGSIRKRHGSNLFGLPRRLVGRLGLEEDAPADGCCRVPARHAEVAQLHMACAGTILAVFQQYARSYIMRIRLTIVGTKIANTTLTRIANALGPARRWSCCAVLNQLWGMVGDSGRIAKRYVPLSIGSLKAESRERQK